MTKINDPANLGSDLFGYKIKYNQVEGEENPNTDFMDLKVKSRFNGNIAEVDWKTNTTAGDNLRRYGYVYDSLNRLLAGFYQKDVNPSAKEYFEKTSYDLNGNITNLKRSEGVLQGSATAMRIDDLNYSYTGNRLNSVTDISGQYSGYPEASGNPISYDLNGNMEDQKDKGILKINYNILNLPDYYKFDIEYIVRNKDGENEIRNVRLDYLYRADGTKLRKKYTYFFNKGKAERYNSTDYLDGFQYSGSQGVMTLDFLPTPEGYYDFKNNSYIYSYTDHLGNVRLSYQKDGSGNANPVDENNYYPFGLKHEGYNYLSGNSNYQYKYNNKELQTETGMYDYGARFYMPDIGRWSVVDELAEKSRRFSTYTYALDNPIIFVDPDGREAQQCCGIWNLTKAYYSGLYEGGKSLVQGTVNFVKHPINTLNAQSKAMAKDPVGAMNSQFKSVAKTFVPITNVYSLGYTAATKGVNAAGKEAGADLTQKVIELAVAGTAKGVGNVLTKTKATPSIFEQVTSEAKRVHLDMQTKIPV